MATCNNCRVWDSVEGDISQMIGTKWKSKHAKYLQPLSARKAVSESGIDSKHYGESVHFREKIHTEAKRLDKTRKDTWRDLILKNLTRTKTNNYV